MIDGLLRRWRRIRYPHPVVDPETQRVSAGAPRPLTEVARLAAAAVRRFGWRGTLDRLRGVGAGPDPEVDYATWCQRHTPDAAALAAMAEQVAQLPYQPLLSIITPVWNTDPRWLSACVESVRRQIYPHWELCLADDASENEGTRAMLRELAADPRIKVTRLPVNGHISAASNAALATASGDFVVMLDHDDELTPDALFEVVRHLNQHPDADMIYSDEDKLDLEGRRCDPYFKPDWSPDHFFTSMYTCHMMTVRRSLVGEIGNFRLGYEGAQDYDLVLRVMERTNRIDHIPKILYRWRKLPESAASALDAKPWAHEAARRALADHFRRSGEPADVLPGAAPGSFRIRYQITGSPLVSIIIAAGGSDAAAPLASCLRSLGRTRYPRFEVVVVSDAPEMPGWIGQLPIADRIRWQTHRPGGTVNLSERMASGAAAARGEHLLLLSESIEALDDDWLEAMLEFSQIEAVGAVGAKLLYPDGRLRHIGLVLGVCGVAAQAFDQHPASSFGYASSAAGVRNYSAVSAACLMTRRAVFDQVGGFDPRFPVELSDLDYCLRVRAAGHRIVFTPYARLTQRERDGVTRPPLRPDDERLFRERWGAVLERDPYYNPNLCSQHSDYRLGP